MNLEIKLILEIPEGTKEFQIGYRTRALEQIHNAHIPDDTTTINTLLESGWALVVPTPK